MRFLGFSNHGKGPPRQENRLFHYPPEVRGKRSVASFREVGGALKEVHRLPREALRKKNTVTALP
jgi:hypothetical protein